MDTIVYLFAVLENPKFLLKLIFSIFSVLFTAHMINKYVIKKWRAKKESHNDPEKDRAHADYVFELITGFTLKARILFAQRIDVLEKFVQLHASAQKFTDTPINGEALRQHYPSIFVQIMTLRHKMRRDQIGISRGHTGDEITARTLFVPTGRGVSMISVSEVMEMKSVSDPSLKDTKRLAREFADHFVNEVDDILKLITSNH